MESKQLKEYREFIGEENSEEIGKEFKVLNYSSVSSIIESMKANLAGNKKLKKQVENIKSDFLSSN